MTKKYYLIIIGVLVILNVFSWRIWWDGFPAGSRVLNEVVDKHPGRKDEGGMRFLEDKLDLNKDQRQGFEQLRNEYFTEIGKINENTKVLRKELLDHIILQDKGMNVDSIFKLMAEHKVMYEKATFKHFNEMRQLCNEQQKEVFDTLFMQMVNRSNRFNDRGSKGREYRGKESKKKSKPY